METKNNIKKALFLIFFSYLAIYAEKVRAIMEDTDGVTTIHPYNPMDYPDTTMHNSDYYFRPNDNFNIYNPETNVTYKHSYPSYLDSLITNKIEILIENDSILQGADIRIVTNEGIVNLEGTVVSQNQIDEVINIAESVDGVKKIKSQFTIIYPTGE